MASGFIKRAEALLNTASVSWEQKPFQLAAVTYNPVLTGDDAIREMNMGRPAYPAFKDFVEQQLKPLFVDDQGHKISIDAVTKNFRNIQIMAFSFGGVFVQQVGNILVDEMKEVGFEKSEIDCATRQIAVVTAGSVAPIGKSKARFTQIDIFHGKDQRVEERSNSIAMIEAMIEDDQKSQDYYAQNVSYDDRYKCCVPDSNSSEVVLLARASKLQDSECLRVDDAKNGNSEQDPPQEVVEESFHGSPTYFNYSMTAGGMMLRTAMSSALNNALNNSLKNYLKPENFTPLSPPQQLMRSPAQGLDNPDSDKKPIASWRDSVGQEFNFDRKKDFTYVARIIDYDKRMDAAFGLNSNQMMI